MQVSKFLIYGLCDPRTSELRYIGQTTRGLDRIKGHLFPSALKQTSTHKSKWLRALNCIGLKPTGIILEEFSNDSMLSEAEEFWIAYFRFLGCNLTNSTSGGEGGFRHSTETKLRIGNIHRGKSLSKEHMEALWMANKLRKRTPEENARRAASNTGQKRNPESCRKIGDAKRGKKLSEEHKRKLSIALRNRWK
jgi:hypothetical protein